jgi:glutamate-1-semialdehyde 2,1-aminomutase
MHIWWGALVPVLIVAGLALRRRLRLSRAKHPSLQGHVRLAKRLARLMPRDEYDEDRFFTCDGAPEPIAARRRDAFRALAERLRDATPLTRALTAQVAPAVPDLQFISRYRVPVQFSRYVGTHLPLGAFAGRTEGVHVVDLDGNARFDLTGSYGVNVFGHDVYKACMAEAVAAAGALGPVLGSYHTAVADNVGRLCRISGLDAVSFHMSGTEAVMQAVRLARYHTGRSHVVQFCGAYHGWWDDVQPGVGNPGTARHTYVLRDMDDATLTVLRTRHDIACVLVNPLQALHPNAGAPADGTLMAGERAAGVDRAGYAAWLQRLAAVCRERGIVLILDEVFVGFRLAYGGAQEYFGVRADLVTYGKTVAGGFPIGVVCGRADLMRRFRDDRPSDICFARGTFNAHPYVMGAMQAFLRRLDEPGDDGQPPLKASYPLVDATWSARFAALNARLAAEELPVRVVHLASIATVVYTVPGRYHWLFQFYLRAHGLALSWVGTGRLIFSHDYTDGDFAAVTERFVTAAREMRTAGWWWTAPAATTTSLRRQVLRELLRARLAERHAPPSTPSVPA